MRRWGGREAQRLTRLCLETFGTKCFLQIPGVCIGTATTADHRIPRSLGGPDELWNLQPACGPCNSSRGNGTRKRRSRPDRLDMPSRPQPSRKW